MGSQRISVAMCTYNGSRYLQEQLNSIASQKRLPDELVVCDDQSQDNTVDIVHVFAVKANFPVYLHINEKNLGSTKNFEKAIRLCKGDIIALSDQDDVWHSEKLRFIEEAFKKSPGVGAVFSDGQLVDEHLYPLGQRMWQCSRFGYSKQKRLMGGKALPVLLYMNVVTGASMAFRAEFKQLILPIPVHWVHDAWIALLIAATADLAIIHKQLVKYRINPNQQIGLYKEGFLKWLVRVLQRDPNFFLDEANRFRLAYERLLEKDNIYSSKKGIAQVKAKIEHMHARYSIRTSQQKLQGLLLAMRELITLRYNIYSGGGKNALIDLCPGKLAAEFSRFSHIL